MEVGLRRISRDYTLVHERRIIAGTFAAIQSYIHLVRPPAK